MADIESYFSTLKDELGRAYTIATEARRKGYDPIDDVEVKIAKDVAARVEGIVGPPNIAKLIRNMEKSGMAREDIAFEIAKKIANGEIIKASKEYLIEQAVRTGVGILTEGVLVAPTEGIAKVRIKQNPDGSDYVAVYYAGPIRSAGGTAAALSVLLADVARRIAGIGDYRATDTQIERYVEEISIYEARVAHLQYFPPEEHIRIIIKNCPVCVDGEPTEEIEVSSYKNVPGIETDKIRGGIPLVICEGIAQKAAKVLKYAKKLKVNWDWLESVIRIKVKEEKVEIKPDDGYLDGLVAGRPVFSYPSAKGGFRLRYGRSETNGLMGKNIHPATMVLLDNFLAYGTHMKIERPGKGCVVIPHACLEPPVVKLIDGSVQKVRSIEEAEKVRGQVSEILFLGDILVTYGDFLKSNHPLMPPAYVSEIWELEAQEKGVKPKKPKDAAEAFAFSRINNVPLHPDYTLPWHDISLEELERLRKLLSNYNEEGKSLVLPLTEEKCILEKLLVEHKVHNGKIIIDTNYATILYNSTCPTKEMPNASNALDAVNKLSGIVIKPWAPTYIGARMGRPEKAKERIMDGSPCVLFPTGSVKNRSLLKEIKNVKGARGTLNLELARFKCAQCGRITFYRKCDLCGNETRPEFVCRKCGRPTELEMHCGEKTLSYDRRPVDIVSLFEATKRMLGFVPEELKGVKGLSNATRIPERLEKGFLRAKNGVYVFRDGTSRFDATDVVLTHFVPKEIGLTVEKARELGYTTDYLGNELKNAEQLLALYPQDIVLSKNGLEYLFKVSRFIDEMLTTLYGIQPYYKAEKPTDLIGHLCVSLSPHTSAGVLCRIIGYTEANVGYGHPFLIAARRRNCDGDEDSVMLLLDALINFSRRYLDEKRGGTMDAPLVLTSTIDPKEIDDEAHCMEVVSTYNLEFYRACERCAWPSDVKIKTVKDMLGTAAQFYVPITIPGTLFSGGNIRTTYVRLESVPEKVRLEFLLHDKIRAVDKRDAAERLILSHFIPDLYGNLRSFSRQAFRCVNCNFKYRRVPLFGKCIKCGGNLLLTINKGGIQKYLQITKEILNRYQLPDYLKQRLILVENEINNIFEDEKERQLGLSDFI
ncbi:MAG: DNA polymerase II large subunit [Candidatus Bilamarchaeaceae archaeon]